MQAKIVHLTTVHSPFDVRIFHKECKTLAQAGYEVVLIVPSERDQVVNGIRARAVPKPRSRPERMTRTALRVLKAALDERGDVYHFHDPELIPIGVILKLLRKRVIYDVHENVPDDVRSKSYIPAFARGLIACAVQAAELGSAVVFDGIVTATGTIAKRFSVAKTITVQNFPIPDELVSIEAGPYADRPLSVAYVGGITSIRGIKEMVDAIGLVPDSLGVKLLLVGSFSPDQLKAEVMKSPGWQRVEFTGWQPREKVVDLLAQARIGLVLYHDVAVHNGAQPNKLFEYMSAGLPVVASNFSLWRDIVEKPKCGILVDPMNAPAVAEAICWLLEHPKEAEAMGRRGAQMVSQIFNWNSEAKKLLHLYGNLIPSATL